MNKIAKRVVGTLLALILATLLFSAISLGMDPSMLIVEALLSGAIMTAIVIGAFGLAALVIGLIYFLEWCWK